MTGPDIYRPDVDTLEAVAVAQAHGFEQNGRRIQAVRDLAARAREAERDAAAVREKMHHNAANLDVAIEQRMAAEADRDRYRIEADHGHDDYEDAEHVIRQIAEKRPNQTFDPWAAQLCAEFLERPSRTRSTIAEIREDRDRLARRVAELEAALRGIEQNDELVEVNDAAFSIYAFRRCQQIARAALVGDGGFPQDRIMPTFGTAGDGGGA